MMLVLRKPRNYLPLQAGSGLVLLMALVALLGISSTFAQDDVEPVVPTAPPSVIWREPTGFIGLPIQSQRLETRRLGAGPIPSQRLVGERLGGERLGGQLIGG